jgi:hypothetical protein
VTRFWYATSAKKHLLPRAAEKDLAFSVRVPLSANAVVVLVFDPAS